MSYSNQICVHFMNTQGIGFVRMSKYIHTVHALIIWFKTQETFANEC